MAGNTRKILAIDWDPRTLRIVHAQLRKRTIKIDRLLSVAIPETVDTSNPEQMGKHIRQALDQEGISTRHACVDFPRDQAILNSLVLPIASQEDLPGMVRIQIAKELPFSVGDAVIDYAVGPIEKDSSTAVVLVAAVRREVLEQYEATFRAAELKLERIGLRPYSNRISVCELLKHSLPERVVFVDIGPGLSEISVVRQGALAFSRAASVVIPRQMEEPTRLSILRDDGMEEEVERLDTESLMGPTAPSVVQGLIVEITRSIEAYRARDSVAQVDHIVIGGDLGVEDALSEAIQKRLGVSTEIYNPASSFGWEPDEGAAASAFAAPLGVILSLAREDKQHFDFLHPKRSESATQKKLRKAPLVATVALLFIAAAGVTVAKITQPDREELARIQQRIAELKSRESEQKKFVDLLHGKDGIVPWDQKQLVWIDVLADALSVMPGIEQLVLEQIDLNQKEQAIKFKTKTKQRDTASKAVADLEAFRREGKSLPRFKASIGSSSEKSKESYPYKQDIEVTVLDDENPPGKAAAKKK